MVIAEGSRAVLHCWPTGPWKNGTSQQTQNICMTFIQYWTNVEDVCPALYKCYTNVLCLLGLPNVVLLVGQRVRRCTIIETTFNRPISCLLGVSRFEIKSANGVPPTQLGGGHPIAILCLSFVTSQEGKGQSGIKVTRAIYQLARWRLPRQIPRR